MTTNETNKLIMTFPPPPMMLPLRRNSAGMASAVGGLLSGGGSVTMDQVQALLTAMIQQMRGMLADALKNVKRGNDNNDFTASVKVEVQGLNDDRHAKVLDHIQLVISMATMRGLGHAFHAAIAHDLPLYHSDRYKLNLSDLNELKCLRWYRQMTIQWRC